MNMVQEAEAQEQMAIREAQSQDKKSLSISILLEGRPQAFVDFFNLTHGRTAGAMGRGTTATTTSDASSSGREEDAELPQESLLLLKAQLVKADISSREGRSLDVYQAYKVLATYFAKLGKLRNAQFFFKQALSIAKSTASVQSEMETLLALGTVFEELQDVEAAVQCHERRLQVANENLLSADEAAAYQSLTSVYLGQAVKEERAGDTASALVSYSRCLSAAERAGDGPVMAKANYRMGILHFGEARWQDAMFHLRSFVEHGAAALGDKVAEGEAHSALSQCLREVNDTEGSMALLERYLETTQKGEDQHGPAMACCSLGIIYLEQGNHIKAVTYFERFFEIARTLGDRKVLDTARFNLGVAKGALRMSQYMNVVNDDLPKLIKWKNAQSDF